MKKVLSVILSLVLVISVFAACGKNSDTITTGEVGVVKDEEFGNVYIGLTIDEFNTLDLKAGAENYLRRGGLDDVQIAKIEAYLCK